MDAQMMRVEDDDVDAAMEALHADENTIALTVLPFSSPRPSDIFPSFLFTSLSLSLSLSLCPPPPIFSHPSNIIIQKEIGGADSMMRH
jgi:hypothetical protein